MMKGMGGFVDDNDNFSVNLRLIFQMSFRKLLGRKCYDNYLQIRCHCYV